MGGGVVDRANLLTRSGVGVEQHWLVIAPSGNPAIFLDLRVLDRIGVAPPGYADDAPEESEDSTGNEPDHRSYLLLACGELEVKLYVADGPEAVAEIVRAAAPWLRAQTGTPNTAAVTPSGQGTRDEGRDKVKVVRLEDESETPTISRGTLVVLERELAGQKFTLFKAKTRIGRGDENDIVLAHPSVSRAHARVVRGPGTGRYTIKELDPTNGVRVNGQPVFRGRVARWRSHRSRRCPNALRRGGSRDLV